MKSASNENERKQLFERLKKLVLSEEVSEAYKETAKRSQPLLDALEASKVFSLEKREKRLTL